jgi:hypothetical protein
MPLDMPCMNIVRHLLARLVLQHSNEGGQRGRRLSAARVVQVVTRECRRPSPKYPDQAARCDVFGYLVFVDEGQPMTGKGREP